jgi:hypothetical protein
LEHFGHDDSRGGGGIMMYFGEEDAHAFFGDAFFGDLFGDAFFGDLFGDLFGDAFPDSHLSICRISSAFLILDTVPV